jgi:hypothetical protein
MSVSALAFKCDEFEDDLSAIENISVECGYCDEDSPLPIPRSKCKRCGGTGRMPVSFASIVTEIREAKAEQHKVSSGRSNDDLYLEY